MDNEFNKSEVFVFDGMIAYQDGAVVSKHALKKQTGNVSLFAFDKGEALSTHSAPFDALVQVVDGSAEIKIGEQSFVLKKGESIIMPADVPHSVYAMERFKMVLTMIKSL
jgi:quercetin dioxygenase-like cupin family protein